MHQRYSYQRNTLGCFKKAFSVWKTSNDTFFFQKPAKQQLSQVNIWREIQTCSAIVMGWRWLIHAEMEQEHRYPEHTAHKNPNPSGQLRSGKSQALLRLGHTPYDQITPPSFVHMLYNDIITNFKLIIIIIIINKIFIFLMLI